jgi:hypothetical protein
MGPGQIVVHYIGGVWDAASGTVTEGNSLRQEAVIRVGLQSWENRVTGERDGSTLGHYIPSASSRRALDCVCVCVSNMTRHDFLGLQLYSH